MKDALTVERLSCPHCGAQLKGGSEYITFQCGSCFNHFIITDGGLKGINIVTAVPEGGLPEKAIYLPFWAVEIDKAAMRSEIAESIGHLKKINGTIASTRLEKEKEEEDFRLFTPDKGTGMEKIEMIAKIPPHRAVPGDKEIRFLLEKIESGGPFIVYVPAFVSGNPFSYLKVGRFLTALQPGFTRERSTVPGRSARCVISRNEAESLIDLVFFATLPRQILACGKFLERVSLTASGHSELIDFPFLKTEREILSAIGGFSFSPRLLDRSLLCGDDRTAPRAR
jgi:hypothetical protein